MRDFTIFKPVDRPIGPDGFEKTEPEKVVYTRGLWSAGTGELFTFFTSSLQTTASKEYYYEVWSSASLECEDAQLFSVAYGHKYGSGSLSQGGEVNDTPSRSIYSQYRLMCLDPDETTFYLADSPSLTFDDFYVVNFNRSRVGDKLDPGNFELSLTELSSSATIQVSSSGKIITLIDDSTDSSDSLGYGGIPSPVRNLVSGSITNGIHNPTAPHYYGLVYADMGTIIIDARALNASASFNTITGSNTNGNNAYRLFTSISGAAAINYGFVARAVDIKQQDFYFVRINNIEYNYSSNPTYVSGSDGFLGNNRFINEPVTYITTIGLYDRVGGDLLAVAKLSKPIQKSFNSELSITVKLEY